MLGRIGQEKGTGGAEMAGWHHCSIGVSLSELRELVMDGEVWRLACDSWGGKVGPAEQLIHD